MDFELFKQLNFNIFKSFHIEVRGNYCEIKGITLKQNIILQKQFSNVKFLNSYIEKAGDYLELDYQSKLVFFNLKEADLVNSFKEQCKKIEEIINQVKTTHAYYLIINKNNAYSYKEGRRLYLY